MAAIKRGRTPRDLADQFEVAPSSIGDWTFGTSMPSQTVMNHVVATLEEE